MLMRIKDRVQIMYKNKNQVNLIDKLKEKLGKDNNSFSVNIKYNKYSTYSILEYDSIESSNGNLCISDKPKNINTQNYSKIKNGEVTQFTPKGEALFGNLLFNYFE